MSKHQRTKHERTIKYGNARHINRNGTPGVTAWCYVCAKSGELEPTHRWAEWCPTVSPIAFAIAWLMTWRAARPHEKAA